MLFTFGIVAQQLLGDRGGANLNMDGRWMLLTFIISAQQLLGDGGTAADLQTPCLYVCCYED